METGNLLGKCSPLVDRYGADGSDTAAVPYHADTPMRVPSMAILAVALAIAASVLVANRMGLAALVPLGFAAISGVVGLVIWPSER